MEKRRKVEEEERLNELLMQYYRELESKANDVVMAKRQKEETLRENKVQLEANFS